MYIKNKDLQEMFKDSELPQEIQEKISEIFEKEVDAKVKEKEEEIKAKVEADKEEEIKEKIQENISKLEEANEKYKEEVLLKTIEKFSEAAVDEWMEENKVEVENKLVVEMAQDFLQAGTKLFETTGFKIDKKDIDINKDLNERVKNLEEDQNRLVEKNIELKKQQSELLKEKKSSEVYKNLDLTESQIDKVKNAVSKMNYKNDEQFETAVKSIVESYFPKLEDNEDFNILGEQEKQTRTSINESSSDYDDEYYKRLASQLD